MRNVEGVEKVLKGSFNTPDTGKRPMESTFLPFWKFAVEELKGLPTCAFTKTFQHFNILFPGIGKARNHAEKWGT